jgi:hypothetical protein
VAKKKVQRRFDWNCIVRAKGRCFAVMYGCFTFSRYGTLQMLSRAGATSGGGRRLRPYGIHQGSVSEHRELFDEHLITTYLSHGDGRPCGVPSKMFFPEYGYMFQARGTIGYPNGCNIPKVLLSGRGEE